MENHQAGSPRGASAIERRNKRSRLADVAREAGVGIATVDRVVNERGGVRPATARRVIDAARRLAINRILPAPYRQRLRYEVVLARRRDSFFDRLNQAFLVASATLGTVVTVERTFVAEDRPEELAGRVRSAVGRLQGLIIVALDDERVRDAVEEATAAGLPVVALVSDVPSSGRLAYVGIDNDRAGRTAGHLMGRILGGRGKVVAIRQGQAYFGQEERVHGFADVIERRFPDMELAEVHTGRTDPETTYHLLLDLLSRNREIVGLYNAGGKEQAVADGVRAAAAQLVHLGHELTRASQNLLRRGILDFVIDQNPEKQAHKALEVLLHHAGVIEQEPIGTLVPFEIYGPENIPEGMR